MSAKKGKHREPNGEAVSPAQEKLTRKAYERELASLHGELVKLQLSGSSPRASRSSSCSRDATGPARVE
jgi:hypothetical protein